MNDDSHITVLKLSTVQENSHRLMAMTCDKDRLRFQRLTHLHLSPITKFSIFDDCCAGQRCSCQPEGIFLNSSMVVT